MYMTYTWTLLIIRDIVRILTTPINQITLSEVWNEFLMNQ